MDMVTVVMLLIRPWLQKKPKRGKNSTRGGGIICDTDQEQLFFS